MLSALAGSAMVHALAWMLLHFLWQAALIALVLRVVLSALSRASSRARYASCCAALALMLLALPATFWILLRVEQAPRSLVPEPVLGTISVGFYLPLLLLLAWALGSVLMTARLVFGVARLRGLVARAATAPSAWQERLTYLARRVGSCRPVRLLVSHEVDAPLVIGWLRPLILVPVAALTSLPPAYVEALIAHELGHVRRLDYLVNVVQCCVEALLFFHPAVHWVSACVRLEREHCCDDVAVRVTGDPLRFARALTDMEALRGALPRPALGANGGSLVQRVERIVTGQHRLRSERPACVTALGLLLSALSLSVLGAWACSTPAPESSSNGAIYASEAALAAGASSLGGEWLPPEVRRWQPTLVEAAQRHGLDPALLAIVTLVESGGDPSARSPGGALGLMQLMPSTAAQIASERQLRGHSDSKLLDAAYNLDLGAWYLSRQLEAFGAEGSERALELAAVAYSGGPRFARAYRAGSALPAEIEQYRDAVVGMWHEREERASATYDAWREHSLR